MSDQIIFSGAALEMELVWARADKFMFATSAASENKRWTGPRGKDFRCIISVQCGGLVAVKMPEILRRGLSSL
jgi:hypothetical protein